MDNNIGKFLIEQNKNDLILWFIFEVKKVDEINMLLLKIIFVKLK